MIDAAMRAIEAAAARRVAAVIDRLVAEADSSSVRTERVEALSFLSADAEQKNSPSTGSGRTWERPRSRRGLVVERLSDGIALRGPGLLRGWLFGGWR